MKPIEPGCLAIIINATTRRELIGTATQIGRRVDRPIHIRRCEKCGLTYGWETDLMEGKDIFCWCECCLMRIDGYTEPTQTENKEKVKA